MEAKFFRGGVDFSLSGQSKEGRTLRLELLSADHNTAPVAEELLKGKSNYLLGADSARWIHNVPNYARVRYADIYPGISLVFYGTGSELEHDFSVAAGADPSLIAFQLQGAKKIDLSPSGDLRIQLDAGTLILRKPVAYQTSGQQRDPVDANFLLAKDGSVRFRLGAYDSKRPLVIDPVFSFSTYIAGTGGDWVSAVTTDSSGNIYLTGYTSSTDFPTRNAEQPTLECASSPGGCEDAFITKLDPTGKLIFSTYLGGSNQDYGAAIAVDANENVIVAGVTASSDFPHAGAVVAPSCSINSTCYFLASLKPDGSALNYSGQIGGQDFPTSTPEINYNNGRLAVDASGDAYLAGITNTSDFQITSGTLAPSFPSWPSVTTFVLKVDPTGKLLYSTPIPGSAASNPQVAYNNYAIPTGIVVDSLGQVTLSGTAGPGLPTTAGVVASTFPNSVTTNPNATAGYVIQLNSTASSVNYGTYLPGTDSSGGLAINNSSGDLYVTGGTSETTLPVSANAYQKSLITVPNCSSCNTGYIVELNATATSILAASYLGGTPSIATGGTSFTGIALDSHSNVFVGGSTGSADFPLQDAITTQNEDLILAEMPPNLSSVSFGSYLGSTDTLILPGSVFSALAIDSSDNLVVVGTTYASDFPTTAGSLEPEPPPPASPTGGTVHSFVSKINMAIPAPSFCPSTWTVNFGTVAALTSSSQAINVTNCGNAPLNFSSVVSSTPQIAVTQSCGAVPSGGVCPVTLTFTPTNSAYVGANVIFSDNTVILSQTIYASGQGQAPNLQPSSNPFSLGDLLVGTQGPPQGLLIANNGNAPLTISSVSISGTGFSITGDSCIGTFAASTISPTPNFVCAISITFSPSTAGASRGSVTITSNDPVHPQFVVSLAGTADINYAAPVVSSVGWQGFMQQSVQIDNGPVTLAVSGSNFYPASIVQVNGIAQQTTFQNNNLLNVTIAASSLTALGELPLTVVNPSPGGGTSASATLTPYQLLAIVPSFIVSVPATNLLYAAMPATSTSNPNTVIPIDPTTGTLGTPIPVGNDPEMLAASDDGKYLYVALNGDQTVQRINLSTSTVEQTFLYPPNQVEAVTPLRVADMHVVPGSSLEVVVAVTDSEGVYEGMAAFYNDTGLVNAVPAASPPLQITSFAFTSDPSILYALPAADIQGNFFTQLTLDGNGIHYTRPTGITYSQTPNTGTQVVSDGTLLYTSSGQIWNPVTQTEVGTFPFTTPYEYTLAVDSVLKQIYAIGFQSYGDDSMAIVLSSYGTQSLALQNALVFTSVGSTDFTNLVRWGSNGFGFVGLPGVPGSGLYLTRSNAAIQHLTPPPTLTSVSPNSATAGAPDFTLTVTGTSFISTSVVTWNGTPLATTYVSSTQLTASVPASDVASGSIPAATAQIAVTTPAPGGGTSASSASLNFTINVPAANLSRTALSFGTFTEGTSSNGQSVTLTNSGGAALSIGTITVTGDFAETNSCASSLASAATCSISVAFTPTATGTRIGALTINDNASGSPQAVTLTGTGTAPVVIAPAVTLSAASLTFASQMDGTTSTAQVITLTNSGTAALAIASIATSGDFAQTNTCGTSVAIGAGCMISVNFTPTAAGNRAGTLTINDNASGSPQTVALSGGGQAVSISASSPALTISSVGGSATAMIQLSPVDGFTGTVNLMCAVTYQGQGVPNSPPTCSLNPSQQQVSANSPVSSTLTISTTAASASVSNEGPVEKYRLALATLLFLGMLPRRRWRGGLLLTLLCLVVALGGMLGCSGGTTGGASSTPPPVSGTTSGNYQVSVTASSGTATSSMTIPLSVP